MRKRGTSVRLALALALGLLSSGCEGSEDAPLPASPGEAPRVTWSEAELALLASISIERLPPPPPQPSNAVADDPRAASLGHRLFFDAALSSGGAISCASCHLPERWFTDGRAVSVGLGTTARNAPTLVGASHARWLFWDGRRDSLWSQALGPFEAPAEMGANRVMVVRSVLEDPIASDLYRAVFRDLPSEAQIAAWPQAASPVGSAEEKKAWRRMERADRDAVDRAFSNIGKAIAAYERMLRPAASRFDRFAAAVVANPESYDTTLFSAEEVEGLRLFLDAGRSRCMRCHNGPLLTNQSFHHVATAVGASGVPDMGRFVGAQAVLVDPFNCLGRFSDARPEQCAELRFLDQSHLGAEMGKFKTPTLRGLVRTAPYFHDGRATTLAGVIDHYARADLERSTREITPLDLEPHEKRALIAFLETLDGEIDADARWLQPPSEGTGPR